MKGARRTQPGQDKTGQDRTGQDRTGQDRTGQDRTGQDRQTWHSRTARASTQRRRRDIAGTVVRIRAACGPPQRGRTGASNDAAPALRCFEAPRAAVDAEIACFPNDTKTIQYGREKCASAL
eukprot:gene10703-biopygen12345